MTQITRLPTRDHSAANLTSPEAPKVVICGSYRRDRSGLRKAYMALKEANCQILSPTSLDFCSEREGFVLLPGEVGEEPRKIEERHLEAILHADFVWLHAPEGYIGPSGAMELGFSHAVGVPAYSLTEPSDPTVAKFVHIVDSPRAAVFGAEAVNSEPRRPALRPFQRYYARVAKRRGYDQEGVKECLLLLVEEVGELARAVRRSEGLVRHGAYSGEDESQELADVFLYTIHLANVLNIDLSISVQDKEAKNKGRFTQADAL